MDKDNNLLSFKMYTIIGYTFHWSYSSYLHCDLFQIIIRTKTNDNKLSTK